MKTKTIWLDFTVHDKKRSWKWKPIYLRSNLIYDSDGKSWLVPLVEFGWLFFVIHWHGYNYKKLYNDEPRNYHECPAELMQERINELEDAIRKHRNSVPFVQSMSNDRNLWSVLKE
jgi:hypothetical protein